jgi:hypothetical protein
MDEYRKAIQESKAAARRYAARRAVELGVSPEAYLREKAKKRKERRLDRKKKALRRERKFAKALREKRIPHVVTGWAVQVSAAYKNLPALRRREGWGGKKRDVPPAERAAYDRLSTQGHKALRSAGVGTADGYEYFLQGITFYFFVRRDPRRAQKIITTVFQRGQPFRRSKGTLVTFYKDRTSDRVSFILKAKAVSNK